MDVHHPDVLLHVEIRGKNINLYSPGNPRPGRNAGGNERQGYLCFVGRNRQPGGRIYDCEEGVTIEATYFHAPPYTSERAKQKVIDLAKLVSRYSGPIKLHVVNFTDIQLYIYDKCPS